MSSDIIHAYGGAGVAIPVSSGNSLAVNCGGPAKIYRIPYTPALDGLELLGTINHEQQTFGPFTRDTVCFIHTREHQALYQVGTFPVITELKGFRWQPDEFNLNASGTITAAMILSGVVRSSGAGAVTGTLATAAELDAASDIHPNDSITWSVINEDSGAFTVSGSAGHTVVGKGSVQSHSAGMFWTRKVADGTYVTYQVAGQ